MVTADVAGKEAALPNDGGVQLGFGGVFAGFLRLGGMERGWGKKTHRRRLSKGQRLAINPPSADNHLALLRWGSKLIIKAHGPSEPFQEDQYNKSLLSIWIFHHPHKDPAACSLGKDVITRPGL